MIPAETERIAADTSQLNVEHRVTAVIHVDGATVGHSVHRAPLEGGTDDTGGVPDGSTVRIYITNELHGYREPCT